MSGSRPLHHHTPIWCSQRNLPFCILSFGVIPRRLNFMFRHFGTFCSIFTGRVRFPHDIRKWKTECSETSAYKIQTPGNHPKERIQH